MNERERKYSLELLEMAIDTLQGSLDSLKNKEGQISVDLESNQQSSYTSFKVDLTVYHDWSDDA